MEHAPVNAAKARIYVCGATVYNYRNNFLKTILKAGVLRIHKTPKSLVFMPVWYTETYTNKNTFWKLFIHANFVAKSDASPVLYDWGQI